MAPSAMWPHLSAEGSLLATLQPTKRMRGRQRAARRRTPVVIAVSMEWSSVVTPRAPTVRTMAVVLAMTVARVRRVYIKFTSAMSKETEIHAVRAASDSVNGLRHAPARRCFWMALLRLRLG